MPTTDHYLTFAYEKRLGFEPRCEELEWVRALPREGPEWPSLPPVPQRDWLSMSPADATLSTGSRKDKRHARP